MMTIMEAIKFLLIASSLYGVFYGLCLYLRFERRIKTIDTQWIKYRLDVVNPLFSSLSMLIVFQFLTAGFVFAHVADKRHLSYLIVGQICMLKITYNIKKKLKLLLRNRSEDKICGYQASEV